MESTYNFLSLAAEPQVDLHEDFQITIDSFKLEGKTKFTIHSFRQKLIRLYQNALKQVQNYVEHKKCSLIYVVNPGKTKNQLIDISDPTQRELFNQLVNIYRENPSQCQKFFKDTRNKNREFCKTYFQQRTLREGLIVFMSILFQNKAPCEHVSHLKVFCCFNKVHTYTCKHMWEMLNEVMIKDLLNEGKS